MQMDKDLINPQQHRIAFGIISDVFMWFLDIWIESPKRNPYIASWLIFDKGAEKIKRERTAFQQIDQNSNRNS